jgi:ATP-dependent RNA helicase DDX46/PRP5
MFDMGFEPQIRMIIQNVRPDRQTVLFSATFPKQIEKLAKSILQFPLEIVVGERTTVNKDITQYIEVHEDEEKFMRLLQLLGLLNERGSVLIFVDKQDKCDQLFQDLLKSGYPCLSLHGGKDQLDRDHTLHEFKTGMKTVMVATSVAGRGLDVPDIICVVNYNCPNHVEDYVHRVGRTGRAGRKGVAYTFLLPSEDQYAPMVKTILEKAHQPVPVEIEEMAKGFKEKVERGEAHWANSGFVGKGYTFDASEMNEAQKLASMQKRAYEIEQGLSSPSPSLDTLSGIISEKGEDDLVVEEEEDDFYAEVDGSAGGETESKTDNADPSVSAASSSGPLQITDGSTVGSGPISVSVPSSGSSEMTPLERARALAMSMGFNRASGAPLINIPHLPPAPVTADGKIDTKAALNRAKLIAAQMTGKGITVTSADGQSSQDLHFMEEFEINDYPPLVPSSSLSLSALLTPLQARRKVTQRSVLDEITERTSVAIIARGTYVPPGKKLEMMERKLYLLIEGSTEMQVKQARMEIQRLLEEETIKLGTASLANYGKYGII